MSVSQIKEEMDNVEDAAGCCQQETLGTEDRDNVTTEEPEPLSTGHLAAGSTCSLSLDQDEERVVCAGGIEESTARLVWIADTERAFSIYTIPNEDHYDEDDAVQFVEESQQAPTLSHAARGPRHNKKDTARGSLEDFNVLNVEPSPDPNKEKLTCQFCGVTFFHKRTLNQHMKYHKSLFCEVCQQQFSQKYKLKSHRCAGGISSQRFGKSCPLCRKIFKNSSGLRLHSVVHTGERSHRCGVCGKGFTQKGNLNCHLSLHTGEKPFHCGKCGKRFTQKVHLNHHLMLYGHG
ncbi:zinc finger protein 239-like isoform X2 [Pungitius pungitius]